MTLFDRLKQRLGRKRAGIVAGIAAAVALSALIAAGAFILRNIVTGAQAGELGFYEGPTFHLGVQRERKAVFCERDGLWAGDVGIRQPFWRARVGESGEGRAVITYTHHSCAFHEDSANTYDGLPGLRLEWRLW